MDMTNNERNDYVNQRWLECIKSITNVRKGTGCEVGKTYWFECVYCNDGSHFFRKLSDNNHYDEVYITDEELVKNFVRLIDILSCLKT